MHDFEAAEERYRSAMRVAIEFQMSSWTLLIRYNLAYLRYLNGDTATALDEISQVRRDYENTSQEWMICQCWLDESEILLELDDLEDSIAAAQRARWLAKKLGLNSEIGKSLLHEAVAKMRSGETAEAKPLLDEAAKRFEDEGDQVSSAVAKLQTALLRADKEPLAALRDAISVRLLLRDSGLPHRRSLAEIVLGRIQRTAGDAEGAIESFESALALADSGRSEWMQFHAAYELGLSLHGRNSARSIQMFSRAERLLDSLWRRIGCDDLKMTFLADRSNVYTYLVPWARTRSVASALDYSEKGRSRVLRERLLGDSDQLCAADIAKRVNRDEVILEYFISGNDLYIFAIRHDRLLCIERPATVREIQSALSDFDRHIESCSITWETLKSVQHHLATTAKHHLQRLYDFLIAPVEEELRSTIVFAPHSILHNVPMHALYNGRQFLAERFRVAYTPSASLFCVPAKSQQFSGPLLIAFSKTSKSSSVEEVAEASYRMADAAVLVNPSVDELRDALSRPRNLIHIAGHAGIDRISGKFSWIETPQGRLTSRDLANMEIRAKTIVVTGCSSARRLIQPGDEWLGLMRCFYLAGADTIVSALWDVRDTAARHFAQEFYKVFDGNNALTAVETAAAEIRNRQSHPYFWAGFEAFVRKDQS
jgi:CHAT domain-containing protein